MVSEWRSVIAVSLNVGGGVRLIKPAKLCMCTQTLQTQRGRTHGAGCVRQWFRTAEPLGERRYENWNTHTHTHIIDFSSVCCSLSRWLSLGTSILIFTTGNKICDCLLFLTSKPFYGSTFKKNHRRRKV